MTKHTGITHQFVTSISFLCYPLRNYTHHARMADWPHIEQGSATWHRYKVQCSPPPRQTQSEVDKMSIIPLPAQASTDISLSDIQRYKHLWQMTVSWTNNTQCTYLDLYVRIIAVHCQTSSSNKFLLSTTEISFCISHISSVHNTLKSPYYTFEDYCKTREFIFRRHFHLTTMHAFCCLNYELAG